ncbi:symmetrical bis(5'-nucleosyl)-tetraphosphatase [Pseudomonadota bacterium]
MSVYAVGDVQGCYSALCRLLDKLDFDETQDEVWMAGDLVNRGPESASTIRLVKSLPHARVVLGNHDLHLLAVSGGFRIAKQTDTFNDILKAPDADELLSWVRKQPLLHLDDERRCVLVHAGIHPSWTVSQAALLARQVEALLRDDDTFPILLQRMYGDTPSLWSENLDQFDRGRWIINAFTRMRFCAASGEMDFSQAGPPGSQAAGLYPWFDLFDSSGYRVVFGHWSLLGAGIRGNTISLDSGCAHGGRLTAIDIEALEPAFLQVSCADHSIRPGQ